MTTTTHSMLVTIPHGDPDIGAELDAMVTFTYRPGSPDTYDSARGGPGGWDPGYPPEVEFISAERYCNGQPAPYYGAFSDLDFANLQDIARDWLEGDDGTAQACSHAEHYLEPDPDYARDMAKDDWKDPDR